MKILNHEIHEPREKPISFRRRLDFVENSGQNLFMADDMSRRMERLETHIAHLEHQVEQLNAIVTEQDKLLGRLKKEAQRQSSAMETLELERIKSHNVRPPHH